MRRSLEDLVLEVAELRAKSRELEERVDRLARMLGEHFGRRRRKREARASEPRGDRSGNSVH